MTTSVEVVVLSPQGSIPAEAVPRLLAGAQLRFTPEVTQEVRALFATVPPGEQELWVTYDPQSPALPQLVRQRAVAGVSEDTASAYAEAVAVMARALRQGEWEQGQTHRSLLPYLREETAEFCSAVELAAAPEHLRDELADILLQVLFHAEIAHREGEFDRASVPRAFVAKMRRRAPYLWDAQECVIDAATQDRIWQEAKAAERQAE